MELIDRVIETIGISSVPLAKRPAKTVEATVLLQNLLKNATPEQVAAFKKAVVETGLGEQHGIWAAFTAPTGVGAPLAAMLFPTTGVIGSMMKTATSKATPAALNSPINWVLEVLGLAKKSPDIAMQIQADVKRQQSLAAIKSHIAASMGEQNMIQGRFGDWIEKFKGNAMAFVLGALAMALYFANVFAKAIGGDRR